MADMKFLAKFNRDIDKLEGVTGTSIPPRYWHSMGNLVLNKIMSGAVDRGIPQGRLTGVCGPSGSGKSFILGNMVKAAQDDGAYCLLVDSENALDDEFMSKIGVDTHNNYMYKSVLTIPHVTKIISSFIKGYKEAYADDIDSAPKIFIGVDSLDMLLTDTEVDHYKSGTIKGDQGQKNKQLKAMLKCFVQDIKYLNITIVVTGQVYRNQDQLNGEGVFIVSDAVRYSLSQIILVTKLNLKGKGAEARDILGMRMKCVGFKTRFTKEKQAITMEVPYESGMSQYSGLIEVLLEYGLIEKAGSRYRDVATDDTFFAREIDDHAERFIPELIKINTAIMGEFIEGDEDVSNKSTKSDRMAAIVADM